MSIDYNVFYSTFWTRNTFVTNQSDFTVCMSSYQQTDKCHSSWHKNQSKNLEANSASLLSAMFYQFVNLNLWLYNTKQLKCFIYNQQSSTTPAAKQHFQQVNHASADSAKLKLGAQSMPQLSNYASDQGYISIPQKVRNYLISDADIYNFNGYTKK